MHGFQCHINNMLLWLYLHWPVYKVHAKVKNGKAHINLDTKILFVQTLTSLAPSVWVHRKVGTLVSSAMIDVQSSQSNYRDTFFSVYLVVIYYALLWHVLYILVHIDKDEKKLVLASRKNKSTLRKIKLHWNCVTNWSVINLW